MNHNHSINSIPATTYSTHRRTNQQWLNDLRSSSDSTRQHRALEDLAQYLGVVAYNALQKRRQIFLRLREMDDESLRELTQDLVQDVMIKLSRHNFKLLDKYGGRGKFTSWVAQIINNEIASEFRKVYWERVRPLNPYSDHQIVDSSGLSPETTVIDNCMQDTLHHMINELPNKLRVPLIRCILQEERAAVVGADLGISANAVYSLVHRAKQTLHEELNTAGYSTL